MKRLLLFGIILASISGYGQVKISNLPAATAPDADDPIIINQDGVTSRISKSLFQWDLSDSLARAHDSLGIHLDTLQAIRDDLHDVNDTLGVHLDTIQTHRDDILTNLEATNVNESDITDLNEVVVDLQGLRIVATDSGDSLEITLPTGSYKIATDSKNETDVTIPYISSADIGISGNDKMLILFSENMNGDSIPTHTHGSSGFSVYNINGDSAVQITATYLSNDTCLLTLDSAILENDNVYLRYDYPASGYIQDAAGNKMNEFNSYSVTLSVTTATTFWEQWLFNDNSLGAGNIAGENDSLTLQWQNADGEEYSTERWEGEYSASSAGTATALYTTTQWTIPDTFTICYTYRSSGSETRYALGFDDGGTDILWVIHDLVAGGDGIRLEVRELPGTDTYAYSETGALTSNGWDRVALRVKPDTMSIFINGVYSCTDSLIDDFSGNTVEIWAMGVHAAARGYGRIDALRIYDEYLTDAQILEDYTNKSQGVTEAQDTPTGSEYTMYWYDEFKLTPGVEYDETLWRSTGKYNAGYFDYRLTNTVHPASVAIEDSDTCLQSFYGAGHMGNKPGCDTHPQPTGTGAHWEGYPNSDLSGYQEVYMTVKFKVTEPFDIGNGAYYWAEMKLLGMQMTNDGSGVNDATCKVRLARDDNQGYHRFFTWYWNNWENSGYRGDYIEPSTAVTTDTWHTYTIRFCNNTAGSANGIVELFYDRVKLGGTKTGIEWSSGAGMDWDHIDFATFLGGCKPNFNYEAIVDQYMWISKVALWMPTDADVPAIRQSSPTGRTLDLPPIFD